MNLTTHQWVLRRRPGGSGRGGRCSRCSRGGGPAGPSCHPGRPSALDLQGIGGDGGHEALRRDRDDAGSLKKREKSF